MLGSGINGPVHSITFNTGNSDLSSEIGSADGLPGFQVSVCGDFFGLASDEEGHLKDEYTGVVETWHPETGNMTLRCSQILSHRRVFLAWSDADPRAPAIRYREARAFYEDAVIPNSVDLLLALRCTARQHIYESGPFDAYEIKVVGDLSGDQVVWEPSASRRISATHNRFART